MSSHRQATSWLAVVCMLVAATTAVQPAAAATTVGAGAGPFDHLSLAEWISLRKRHAASVAGYDSIPKELIRFGGARGAQKDYSNVAAAAAAAAADDTTVPRSVSWRVPSANPAAAAAVTRVKNQAKCGSCWAFSLVAAIEGANAVANKRNGTSSSSSTSKNAAEDNRQNAMRKRPDLAALSEQYVMDCVPVSDNHGCLGGNIPQTAHALVGEKLPLEQGYEYLSYGGKDTFICQQQEGGKGKSNDNVAVRRIAAVTAPATSPAAPTAADAMKLYVASHGPLSVAVHASNALWQRYASGVLSGCPPTNVTMLDHGVAITGYGEETTICQTRSAPCPVVPYWIVKNSWGPRWGEAGYVRLRRGTNECGVELTPLGFRME